MIDLHTHFLPGLDDGARDLREAVEMCALALEDGCEALVATPHQRHDQWPNTDLLLLRARLAEVQAAVGARPALFLGAEIRVDSELLSELERPEGPTVLALAGSRYLLIEFDRSAPRPDPVALVHELAVAGWRPVIAHPELIPWLAADDELASALVAQGARMQVTAMSVTGGLGAAPRERCARWLDAGWVHFVASDSHGTLRRPPGLRRASQVIAERWGEDLARQLTCDNPLAVLEDRDLPAPAAEPVEASAPPAAAGGP